jgi:hypothetical protein
LLQVLDSLQFVISAIRMRPKAATVLAAGSS